MKRIEKFKIVIQVEMPLLLLSEDLTLAEVLPFLHIFILDSYERVNKK